MIKIISVLGYFSLISITVLLFSFALLESVIEGLIGIAVIMALVLISLLFEKGREAITTFTGKKMVAMKFERSDIFNFLAIVCGALLTYTLGIDFGLGEVVSAALVAIIAAVLIPKYGVPAYCGAFVGMSSEHIFAGHIQLLLAAAIAGLVFVAAKPVFNGFGGRLGTIAFTGTAGAAWLMEQTLLDGACPTRTIAGWIILYSILGAVITMVISLRLKKGPVMSSGIISLIGGMLLPVIHPEIGGWLAIVVMCASFAGMSTFERIANEILMAIAGLILALVFIYTNSYFGGCGGKLGTIAFGSVIAVKGGFELFELSKSYLRRGKYNESGMK